MAKKQTIVKRAGQEHRQELVKLIKQASYMHPAWRVWDDLMYFSAAALAQPLVWVQAREDEYLSRMASYSQGTQDLFPQMFAEIVLAYEQERFADVLGGIYMELNLGNHWHGQFFTPDHICQLMAKMQFEESSPQIKPGGYITVNDPCCGAGALLIAFAGVCEEKKVNYQRDVLFVAQDIDAVVARMCFISMSLLGMAGCVIVGNVLQPDNRGWDYWYTPLYFLSGFHIRTLKGQEEAV